MMRWILPVALAATLSGCAIGRPDIANLATWQQEYYDLLGATMTTQKETLKRGLREQLEADLVRDRNLLQWERDLEKAAILLQQNPNVTGNQRLLMMTLGESQLASLHRMQAREEIDVSRAIAIEKLYDAVIAAAAALRKNNDTIVSYLGSGNAEFAIRSLDVEGIARVVTAIRRAGEEIEENEEAAAQKRKEEKAKLEKNIERAREVILKALGGK